MRGIKIVVDSASCLPKELIEEYSISVIPFYFQVGDKIYKDGIDITVEEAYKFVEKGSLFKAFPPKVEDFLNLFKRIEEKQIIFVSLSSTFSRSIKNCQIAKEMISDKRIEIIDSLNAGSGEGLIVLEIVRLIKGGRKFDEVVKVARNLAMIIKTVVLLDTIKQVFRTGRIPKFLSDFGVLLSLKPVVMLYNGKIRPIKLVRDKDKGIEKLIDFIKEKKGDKLHVFIMHANDGEKARKLYEYIKENFSVEEIYISEFSPIMGFATGRGTIGISFYSEEDICF